MSSFTPIGNFLMPPFGSSSAWSKLDLCMLGIRQWLHTKNQLLLKRNFHGFLSSLWFKISTVLFVCNACMCVCVCVYMVCFCFCKWLYACSLILLLVFFVVFLNDLVEHFFSRAGHAILSTVCNQHLCELSPPWHRHRVSGLVRKYVRICSCVRGYTHTYAKLI